ncbi:hypothetical protein B0H66DRAFT_626729 [Apodospora peruviana]|uniref:Uncharacterized protein n=1 Tax=Apodospora peruviana TaxID=516989 RepID=A0AAE0M2U6_9PEZI|nr:hypothetical protein B0H66DRAFT_626729 [Apodospora peruviana]
MADIPWSHLIRVPRWLIFKATFVWLKNYLFMPELGRHEVWRPAAGGSLQGFLNTVVVWGRGRRLSLVPFNLIDTLQGPPTRPIYYRISVGSSVKYLMGLKPLSNLIDCSGYHLGFVTVPAGDWDVGILAVDDNNSEKFAFVTTEKRRFPDLTPAWHASQIDLLELGGSTPRNPRGLRATTPSPYPIGRLSLSCPPRRQGCPSLLEQRPKSIAPRFVAHLTDNRDRVIGYVLESVSAGVRNAGSEDLDFCREVLQNLHSLRILHGRLHRHTLLIREDEVPVARAQLQFFHSSREDADEAQMEEEMARLEEILAEPLPEPVVAEVSDELTDIMARDGYVHPVLFWQLKHDGKITVSEEDHRALLAELVERDWHCSRDCVEDAAMRLRENGGRLPVVASDCSFD